MTTPADIFALEQQLAAIEADAKSVVSGLSEDLGTWQAATGSWSVAECFDHLAVAGTVYLRAMEASTLVARSRGRWRKGPALPGLIGGWFVRRLEPPVRVKINAPRTIQPRPSPPLHEAVSAFLESHADVRRFLAANDDLDLAGIRFPNPFVPGVRFSLATGVHVIAAHDRRHLWQARRVRAAAEDAAGERQAAV